MTTYCDNCGERGSGRNDENLCPKCAREKRKQNEHKDKNIK